MTGPTLPPFLIAAALALWGWRSGNYAAAAALALLAESPHWLRWRFNLQHADFTRIATLSTTAFVSVLGWLFISIEPPRTARAVLTTLLWLPAILSPVLLAQQLSTSGGIPLSSLFRYLRKLKARDPATSDPAVDLRPAYFAICLVAAGIPNRRDELFYFAAVACAAWAFAACRPRHASWKAWISLVVIAAGIGYAGHRGLSELQSRLEDWITDWYASGLVADPYRSSTDLGSVGRLKMVESIVLRVYAPEQEARQLKLLHRASFTSLHGKTWVARGAPMKPLDPQSDGSTWPLVAGQATGEVRIVSRLEGGKALLALPSGTLRILSMPAAGLKRNSLGAVEADVGGDWAPYVAAFGEAQDFAGPGAEDLALPVAEQAAFTRVARELGLLPGVDAGQALRQVREHFSTFAYSTFREAPTPQGITPLADFLLRSRSGHCEYFAAASTLLLRAAGVPARYATGFAMVEHSALEQAYVVRARHAHAWVRAYVDGRWVDVDTTPPTWIEEEASAVPAWQKLADILRWATFRLSENGSAATHPGWYAALLFLVALFTWRVLRGKWGAGPQASRVVAPVPIVGADSEFFQIEQRLARRTAQRPAAEPLGAWVARAAAGLDVPTMARMQAALDLHERYRFDPLGLSEQERRALRESCAALAAALD